MNHLVDQNARLGFKVCLLNHDGKNWIGTMLLVEQLYAFACHTKL